MGAYNSGFAAASPIVRERAEEFSGAYVEPVGRIEKPSHQARSVKRAATLWETTERILKEEGVC